MIKPTVGRVIHYYSADMQHTDQPKAALITYVHSDTLINVGGFDHNGRAFFDTSVLLLQGDSYGNPGGGSWARWMPYQKAVA